MSNTLPSNVTARREAVAARRTSIAVVKARATETAEVQIAMAAQRATTELAALDSEVAAFDRELGRQLAARAYGEKSPLRAALAAYRHDGTRDSLRKLVDALRALQATSQETLGAELKGYALAVTEAANLASERGDLVTAFAEAHVLLTGYQGTAGYGESSAAALRLVLAGGEGATRSGVELSQIETALGNLERTFAAVVSRRHPTPTPMHRAVFAALLTAGSEQERDDLIRAARRAGKAA